MLKYPASSFAAICDGRPDDQLGLHHNRLHTFGIIQDKTPSDILAFASRIRNRLGKYELLNWAGRNEGYRELFANAFYAELPSTGMVHLYEATESEMIECIPAYYALLPPRSNFTIHWDGQRPVAISINGVTTNQRTSIAIPPRTSWSVGVVVSWISVAVSLFYFEAERQAHLIGHASPTMILLPDRFPLDNVKRPGATSLMRALLHYLLNDRVHLQYAGSGAPDTKAELLIDNIVGLFNQRHEFPDSSASQIAFRMMADSKVAHQIAVKTLRNADLQAFLLAPP